MVDKFEKIRNSKEYVAKIIEQYSPNVEYDFGYKNRESKIWVRCKTCGFSFPRAYHTIAHCKKPVQCPWCKEIARTAKRREKEKKKRKKAPSPIQISMRVCERCGSLFVPKRRDSRFCCVACSRANSKTRNGDARLNRNNVDDWNINLKELAQRDDNICWICGEEVDWDDHHSRDDGTFIAGERYPSIDHIIPIAKGGRHAWSNVALAHRNCNARKQDRILDDPRSILDKK